MAARAHQAVRERAHEEAEEGHRPRERGRDADEGGHEQEDEDHRAGVVHPEPDGARDEARHRENGERQRRPARAPRQGSGAGPEALDAPRPAGAAGFVRGLGREGRLSPAGPDSSPRRGWCG